jgi:hypothetical protein
MDKRREAQEEEGQGQRSGQVSPRTPTEMESLNSPCTPEDEEHEVEVVGTPVLAAAPAPPEAAEPPPFVAADAVYVDPDPGCAFPSSWMDMLEFLDTCHRCTERAAEMLKNTSGAAEVTHGLHVLMQQAFRRMTTARKSHTKKAMEAMSVAREVLPPSRLQTTLKFAFCTAAFNRDEQVQVALPLQCLVLMEFRQAIVHL